ncbi:MAG: hypothetical protein INQ03_24130 [Candidatus Heimdallarchaeota archaeon]|nr:hypothetical protein [Candidatus Heimdallarchaeota archaeon]
MSIPIQIQLPITYFFLQYVVSILLDMLTPVISAIIAVILVLLVKGVMMILNLLRKSKTVEIQCTKVDTIELSSFGLLSTIKEPVEITFRSTGIKVRK